MCFVPGQEEKLANAWLASESNRPPDTDETSSSEEEADDDGDAGAGASASDSGWASAASSGSGGEGFGRRPLLGRRLGGLYVDRSGGGGGGNAMRGRGLGRALQSVAAVQIRSLDQEGRCDSYSLAWSQTRTGAHCLSEVGDGASTSYSKPFVAFASHAETASQTRSATRVGAETSHSFAEHSV